MRSYFSCFECNLVLGSKTKGLVWVLAACLLGVIFTLGISPLARIIPWKFEKKLSQIFLLDRQKATCPNNLQAKKILEKLSERLYPLDPKDNSFSVNISVVRDSKINAYATLGGIIFINSALLEQAESPEEIAGILAHEISHVSNRDILQGFLVHLFTIEGIKILISGSIGVDLANHFLNMNFTKSQEAKADKDGLARLEKAQISNQGIKDFFKRMQQSNFATIFLSDHPSNQARIEMAKHYHHYESKPIMTEDEWKILKNFCRN